ncbi:MAG: flavin reductase [Bacilli bacterium]|nr:flavin reductase [Bacilli bacterium]
MIDNNVFRDISYGMYLVTTKNEDFSSGCIINTLIQITSQNPLIAISLNKNNATHDEIVKSKRFAVSVLSEETNQEVIKTFGYFSSKEINKFEKVKYEEKNNLPVVLEDISSYLICNVVNIIDCETHDLFIGRVEVTNKVSDKIPMTYKYYHENRKGTSPKNAPTFIEEKKKDAYRCTICGYIYDNEKEEIPFEELPDDWVCPRCGVGKELFEKI